MKLQNKGGYVIIVEGDIRCYRSLWGYVEVKIKAPNL